MGLPVSVNVLIPTALNPLDRVFCLRRASGCKPRSAIDSIRGHGAPVTRELTLHDDCIVFWDAAAARNSRKLRTGTGIKHFSVK